MTRTVPNESLRILVVDDDDSVRRMLVEILEFEGYDVEAVAEGQSALEKVLSQPFDLVLTDLEMPRMNGITLVSELRKLRNPPVAIMMTGYGTVESALGAMRAGAWDYILKPFQLEEVLHLVARALQHRQLEAENMQLQESVALYRIGEKLNRSRSEHEIADILVEAVTAQLAPDVFAWWKLDEDGWALVRLQDLAGGTRDADKKLRGAMAQVDSVAVLKAFHADEPLLLSAGRVGEVLPGLGDEVSAGILVPMRAHDRVVGMLGAFLRNGPAGFTEGNRRSLQLVADRAAMSLENTRLLENLQRTFLQTIESLVGALEAKDEYTKGHSERVMQWALILGELMELSDPELEDLRRAALLHDVGKIGLNLEALNKPQKLSVEEYERFKLHPVLGKRILEPIDFLRGAIPAVLHHHEHWDGKGYPLGLAGSEIPVGARILGIADAFEVMITDRVYRKALPLAAATAELERCAGAQFDPAMVGRFVEWLSQFEDADALPVKGGRRTTWSGDARGTAGGAGADPVGVAAAGENA